MKSSNRRGKIDFRQCPKRNSGFAFFARPLCSLWLIYPLFLILLSGCTGSPDNDVPRSGHAAKINPDYSGVIIPPDIAPLNFSIKATGSSFVVRISSAAGNGIEIHSNNGKIQIPRNKWSELLDPSRGKELKSEIYIRDEQGKWLKYNDITNFISNDPVDPYLYYRILYPGYESFSELSINRRELSGFGTKPVLVNSVAEENCINCHAFNNGRTDDFMFHMRGSLGGTYISSGGGFRKINLKTAEMKNGAVYPRWHPSGKFIAFSANKIVQQFHAADNKKVEVTDLESSLVLYDIEKNEMMNINLSGSEMHMDTYPEWAPDGRYLYFCRARQVGQEFDYTTVRYNLYRVSFNADDKTAGEPELVFNAEVIKKSVSFPRVSPDGRFLVFTLADYGCFPIWHKEADLHSINLENLQSSKLELNSDFTDSYHSWSSNSRWLVFSSKRIDGLTARLILHISMKTVNQANHLFFPRRIRTTMKNLKVITYP